MVRRAVLCVGWRRYEKEQKRKAPPVPNAEGIPRGSYTDSCNGCAMDEEGAAVSLSLSLSLSLRLYSLAASCCAGASTSNDEVASGSTGFL